jgi:hypothetical protein
MCLTNTALALVMVGSMALVVASKTAALANSSIGTMLLGNPIVVRILPYAVKYAFDFVIVSTIVWTACKGFKYGLVDGIRAVFAAVGGIVAVAVAFYLPFSSFRNHEYLQFINTLNEKFGLIFARIGIEFVQDILGKVLTGVLLCSILLPLVLSINSLLTRLSRAIRMSPTMRKINGCLSSIVFLAVGVWACCEIMELLCLADYLKILNVHEYFSSGSLADAIYSLFKDSAKALYAKLIS